MRIAVVHPQTPFVRGGAETHTESVVAALREAGHEAEEVVVAGKWYPATEIVHQMAVWRALDLSESNGLPIDMVIALKFPAYLVPHERKVVWLIHQHRTAYELWDHPEFADLGKQIEGPQVRDMVQQSDRIALGEAKRIFTNSKNVQDRLWTRVVVPLRRHIRGPEEDQVAVPAVFGAEVEVAQESDIGVLGERLGHPPFVLEQDGVVDVRTELAEEAHRRDVGRRQQPCPVGDRHQMAPARLQELAQAGARDPFLPPGPRHGTLLAQHVAHDPEVGVGLGRVGERSPRDALVRLQHLVRRLLGGSAARLVTPARARQPRRPSGLRARARASLCGSRSSVSWPRETITRRPCPRAVAPLLVQSCHGRRAGKPRRRPGRSP